MSLILAAGLASCYLDRRRTWRTHARWNSTAAYCLLAPSLCHLSLSAPLEWCTIPASLYPCLPYSPGVPLFLSERLVLSAAIPHVRQYHRVRYQVLRGSSTYSIIVLGPGEVGYLITVITMFSPDWVSSISLSVSFLIERRWLRVFILIWNTWLRRNGENVRYVSCTYAIH